MWHFWRWGRTLVFLEALHLSSLVSLLSLKESGERKGKRKHSKLKQEGLKLCWKAKEKKPPLVALLWGKNERKCGEIKVFVEM